MQMQPVVDLPGFIAAPKGAPQSGPSESAPSFSDVHDAIVAGNSKNQKRSDLPADHPPTDPPKKNELVDKVDKEEGRTATAGAAAIPAQPAQPTSSENNGAAPADQSAPIQAITDPLLAIINAAEAAASLLAQPELTQPEPQAGAIEFTNLLQAAVTEEAVNTLENPVATDAELAPTQKTPADSKSARPPTSEIPPGLAIAQARAADPAQPALEKVILAKTAGQASDQEVATHHQNQGLHRGHAFARGQEVATAEGDPLAPPTVAEAGVPTPAAAPEASVKDNSVSLAMGKSFVELLGGQTAQGNRPPTSLHAKTDDSLPPQAPPEDQVEQPASTRNSQLSTGQEENRGGNGDPANGGLVEKGLPAATHPRSFSQEFSTQNLTASQQQPSTAASTGAVQLPSGAVVTDQQVVSQVVTQLSMAIRPHGEGNSITINLHPEELGRLKLELEVHKDTVKAHLLAQTQQAQEILERHLPRLREALTQQGLRLDEIRIDVEAGLAGGSRGFQHESGGARFGFQPPAGQTASSKPVAQTLMAKMEPAGRLSGQTGLSLRI